MQPPTPSIFITGAAAGIGQAVAQRFARAGWFVGAYDVDEAGVRALRQRLGGPGHAGRLDVTSEADWQAQLEAFCTAAGGRLDVLVNNAGIAVTSPFAEADLARHHRLIDVNLRGVVNGCHLAFPYLRQTPGARVINLCSASALFGQPMLASYSASKAAVRSLTEALSMEWRRHGVGVADVMPLFVQTAMVEQEVSKMKTVQTLGVRLTADDVAAAIWRLAQGPIERMPLHTPVGWQTRLFYLLARLSPDAINRLVTARMAGL
jgi:NAD(P)-dependent dehydrogenase (short-subunit alcohol dehydrogenase family)